MEDSNPATWGGFESLLRYESMEDSNPATWGGFESLLRYRADPPSIGGGHAFDRAGPSFDRDSEGAGLRAGRQAARTVESRKYARGVHVRAEHRPPRDKDSPSLRSGAASGRPPKPLPPGRQEGVPHRRGRMVLRRRLDHLVPLAAEHRRACERLRQEAKLCVSSVWFAADSVPPVTVADTATHPPAK